ncbi:unnamed protein product, partial [Sphenostylis stenocarpa]
MGLVCFIRRCGKYETGPMRRKLYVPTSVKTNTINNQLLKAVEVIDSNEYIMSVPINTKQGLFSK